MENDAIDEGLRSLKEEPTITFEESSLEKLLTI
jgi:hypothetical protein